MPFPDSFLDLVLDMLDRIEVWRVGRPNHADDVERFEMGVGVFGLVAGCFVLHKLKLRMFSKVIGNDRNNVLAIGG